MIVEPPCDDLAAPGRPPRRRARCPAGRRRRGRRSAGPRSRRWPCGIHGLIRSSGTTWRLRSAGIDAEQRAVGGVDERVLADPHLARARRGRTRSRTRRRRRRPPPPATASSDREREQEDEQRAAALACGAGGGGRRRSGSGRHAAVDRGVARSCCDGSHVPSRSPGSAAPPIRSDRPPVRVVAVRGRRAQRRGRRSGSFSGAALRSGRSAAVVVLALRRSSSTPRAASGTAPRLHELGRRDRRLGALGQRLVPADRRERLLLAVQHARVLPALPAPRRRARPGARRALPPRGRARLARRGRRPRSCSSTGSTAAASGARRRAADGRSTSRCSRRRCSSAPSTASRSSSLLAVATFLARRARAVLAGRRRGRARAADPLGRGSRCSPRSRASPGGRRDRGERWPARSLCPRAVRALPVALGLWIGHPLAFLDAQKVVWERSLSPAGPLGGVVAGAAARASCSISRSRSRWSRSASSPGAGSAPPTALYALDERRAAAGVLSDRLGRSSRCRGSRSSRSRASWRSRRSRRRRAARHRDSRVLGAGLAVDVVRWALWYWVA